jgi:glutathione S-transferase
MSKARTLIQLSYSPWSERARWALDHQGIAYDTVEHIPFLGELRLRRVVGNRATRATVPVLLDGDSLLTESWDIVRYADRIGSGSKLIPESQEHEVRAWTELADQASSQGRALVVYSLLASDAALDEGLPFPLPSWLHTAMRPVTRFGLRWFARKYGLTRAPAKEYEDRVRPALDRLREAVKKSPYVVGNGYIRLGPATRRAWTCPALEADYADVLRWRDNLYLEHRVRAAKRP